MTASEKGDKEHKLKDIQSMDFGATLLEILLVLMEANGKLIFRQLAVPG